MEERLQLCDRLRSANARSEARDEAKAPPCGVGAVELAVLGRIAPRVEFTAVLQGNPEVGGAAAFNALKALCGNPHNSHGHTVHEECLSQYIRFPRKTPRPVVVAEDGNRCVIRLVLLAEAATQWQIDAEAGEERAADHVAFGFFGLWAIADGDFVAGERDVGDDGREAAVLVAQRVVDGIGKGQVAVDCAGAHGRIGGLNEDKALGVVDRQRAQQHRVHDTEDRGVCAHAESQRQNRSNRKSRTLPKRAEGKAQIAQRLVEECPTVPKIEALLRHAYVAEFAPGLSMRVFVAEAIALELVGFEFKMRLDLFRKILLAALAIEHGQASSRLGTWWLSRTIPMARARRRHSPVFSTSCSRPFCVSV